MPELPEVETTVRQLKKHLIGAKITRVWTDAKKLIKKPPSFSKFKKEIVGSKIKHISRRAKYIIFHLSGKKTLVIHQKLTGHLLLGKWERKNDKWTPAEKGPLEDKYNQYLHVIFWLDSGQMLALSNLRKFATLQLFNKKVPSDPSKKANIKELDQLGPEPLSREFTFTQFKKALKGRRAAIKKILMDQEVISGLGNIYSDEILWKAKVNPQNKVSDLSHPQLKRIYQAIPKVLKQAVKLKGTSVTDYRMPSGKKGGYDAKRRVYRREGEPCPRCGTKIKRVKISGRSTHFCPKCQK